MPTPRQRRPLALVVMLGMGAGALSLAGSAAAATAPASIACSDAGGYADDQITFGTDSGVTWKWRVKGGTFDTSTKGATPAPSVKPFSGLTSTPAGDGLVVEVEASDATSTVGRYVCTFTTKAAKTAVVTNTPVLTDLDPAINLPADLAWKDASGYATDSFDVPKVRGVVWSYAVGSGSAVAVPFTGTATKVTVKPFTGTTAPTPDATKDTVTVTVTPKADFGYKFAGTPKSYTYSFDPRTLAAPPAPKTSIDPATGMTVITIPNVKGVTWTTKDDTADAKSVTFTGTQPYKYVPTSNTSLVAVTATAAPTFTFSTAAPVTTTYVFDVKAGAETVDVTSLGATVKPTDMPGTGADYAEITGTKGVEWSYQTPAMTAAKSVATTPGKVAKVVLPRDTEKATFTATPAKGFTFKDGASTDVPEKAVDATYTKVSQAKIKAGVKDGVAWITPSAAVKAWTFTSAGATKAIPLSVPAGVAQFGVTLPGAGKLVATILPGYSVTAETPSGFTIPDDAPAPNTLSWTVAAS